MKELRNMTNDEMRALANVIIKRETEEQSDAFFVKVGADILNNLFAYGKMTRETLEDVLKRLMALIKDEASVMEDISKKTDFWKVLILTSEKTRFACYVVAKAALENFLQCATVA